MPRHKYWSLFLLQARLAGHHISPFIFILYYVSLLCPTDNDMMKYPLRIQSCHRLPVSPLLINILIAISSDFSFFIVFVPSVRDRHFFV
jgi:hypothetical protein